MPPARQPMDRPAAIRRRSVSTRGDGSVARAEELKQAFDEVITDGVRRGMLHNRAEDQRLDGRTVTVHGRRLVNFGSCSYLGLETHPAMRAGVIDAVDRYGTQFSSSRAFLSAP